jgi:tetratricopeptide (TPR) repeat protein
MDETTLYAQAEAAIKDKRFDDARKLLITLVKVNPRSEAGWLALASTLDDMHQAIDCLKRVLALNPNNEMAKEWLDFAQQELARQAAVAEMKAEDATFQVMIVEPGDETRPVPRLGKYLLDYKFVTEDQLRAALVAQRQGNARGDSKRLGDYLVEQKALTRERLEFAVEEQKKDTDRPVPRLGKYLLDYKFITDEQLKAALAAQRQAAEQGHAKKLGEVLVEQGAITEERLGFAIREQSRSFYSLFND